MNTNTVYIFPDTMPRAELLFPLVQVFWPVVYLRPVENDVPVTADQSNLCREMVEEGLLKFNCPAPLADNRDRFLQLVHDLQHRRDDYAGQLSSLSLAGLGGRQKTETKTSIISTLLKQTGIQDEQDEQRAMILWQARLLLKLGEIFDQEQEELQQHLTRISARENGLLAELRKEDEQPFSLTKAFTAGDDRADGQQRLRLKAWSRLFALGNQQIDASTFITTSRDAFDLLIEQYELVQKIPAQPMLTLPLPGGRAAADTFAEQRAAFINDASGLIDDLKRLLKNPTSINEKDRITLNGPGSKWTNLLEQHYPAGKNSHCTLSLYFLPGVDPGNLFLETFGRDEDNVVKEATEGRHTGIIIGIMEEQAEG